LALLSICSTTITRLATRILELSIHRLRWGARRLLSWRKPEESWTSGRSARHASWFDLFDPSIVLCVIAVSLNSITIVRSWTIALVWTPSPLLSYQSVIILIRPCSAKPQIACFFV
jgi:hypothetical protein